MKESTRDLVGLDEYMAPFSDLFALYRDVDMQWTFFFNIQWAVTLPLLTLSISQKTSARFRHYSLLVFPATRCYWRNFALVCKVYRRSFEHVDLDASSVIHHQVFWSI